MSWDLLRGGCREEIRCRAQQGQRARSGLAFGILEEQRRGWDGWRTGRGGGLTRMEVAGWQEGRVYTEKGRDLGASW